MTLILGPLQTHSLIGRENEQKIIRAAVQAAGLRVIFIIAPAGMGKTRLLSEIPEIFKDESVAFADLIDLYHTDFHTISGIEKTIVDSLDPGNEHFRVYRQRRQLFEERRKAGIEAGELEKLHAELTPQFVQDLNALAAQRRVVLRFDTAELVQSEREIHPLLDQTEGIVEVRGWLTTHIPELDNVTVILAGRPEGVLWDELKTPLGKPLQVKPGTALPDGWQNAPLIEIELGPLTESDVPAYFADLAQRNEHIRKVELIADHYAAIHHLTDGRPLRLAMIAALLARQDKLPDALLAGLERGSEDFNLEYMLDQVWNLSPEIHAMLPFVGWLRKGARPALLGRIMAEYLGSEWTQEQVDRALADLRELPFVKTRPHSNLIFLHDEMYDLMDRFILKQDVMTEPCATTYRAAIEWYEEQIRQVSGEHKQRLILEQLYYRLLNSPEQGFAHYQDISNEALIGREIGFEMALRDEMLRFFLTQKLVRDRQGQLTLRGRRIARDSASRWVQRSLRQSNSQAALDLIERVWSYDQFPFERNGAYLFPCVLLAYKGEAQAYLGQIKEAIQTLNEAIERLNQLQEKPNTRHANFREYLLGLTHKNRGYVYTRQRSYENAIKDYKQAISILKSLQEHIQHASLEMAHVQRNLAYVYGELGEKSDALSYSDRALAHFRELGNRWGEALTLNVQGSIRAKFHEPHISQLLCKQALRLFNELSDQRGIGLSNIELGRAYRRLGAYYSPAGNIDENEDFFNQAKYLFETASNIFQSIVQEPSRRIEAVAEKGKLYRDWLKAAYGRKDEKELEQFAKQSQAHLQEAIRLADEKNLIAESADYRQDLANLYLFQERWDDAEKILQEAVNKLPQEYIFTSERQVLSQYPVPGYLEIFGKAYMTRGDIAYAKKDWEGAIELWTLAAGYFDLFSSDASCFVDELVTDIGKKLFNETACRLKELCDHCQSVEKKYGLSSTALHKMLSNRFKAAEREEREHERS